MGFFDKFRNKMQYLCVIYIILGVLMFFKPAETLKIASIVIGLLLIARGAVRVLENIGTGVFYFAFGIIFILNTRIFASIFPLLFGIMMAINGCGSLQSARKLKELGVRGAISEYVISIITLVIGLVIILYPFKTGVLMTRVIAGCLIYTGITEIINANSRHRLKAEITDADDDVTPID